MAFTFAFLNYEVESLLLFTMSAKKYLMIHADDAGLAWSENKATQQGMLHGSINSTSLMVPCPWFYEMAQFAIKNPALDFGIHLTLTGEWKTYPFRPITPTQYISSLVDKNGHFHPKRQQIRDHAVLDEVRLELINQIEFALSLGMKPTHLDSHMYTLGLRQDLLDLYQELGEIYKLPILLSKTLVSYTGESPSQFNLPEDKCFESLFMASMQEFKNGGNSLFYEKTLDHLPEGLSIILIHPALESEEMNQVTIDHPNFGALWRTEDYNYFSSEACKLKLKENNIELVNFKSPLIQRLLGA